MQILIIEMKNSLEGLNSTDTATVCVGPENI